MLTDSIEQTGHNKFWAEVCSSGKDEISLISAIVFFFGSGSTCLFLIGINLAVFISFMSIESSKSDPDSLPRSSANLSFSSSETNLEYEITKLN